MKKGKVLSVLTSLAMTGSMILSTVPSLTASAANGVNTMGLKMTSAKTSYTLDEVKAGVTATVYVDAANAVAEEDGILSVDFKVKSSDWEYFKPINFNACNPNQISTGAYNKVT